MVKFSIDKVKEIMKDPERIRNISVIAHVDHGKSTLTDSLIAKAGMLGDGQQGKAVMDTLQEEKDRGITIKSASVSLHFEREEDSKEEKQERVKVNYLINLIDSPGHVDFSSEVTAALRLTDGALVVVDCVEGVRVQTETVLREAVVNRVKPILFLNKLDKVFYSSMKPSLEECSGMFRKVVESVNVICDTFKDPAVNVAPCYPHRGNVGFGSGKDGWAFTLRDFAQAYTCRFGLSIKKLMHKLWGEHYFLPEKKIWSTKKESDKALHGFTEFVLRPIQTLVNAIMEKKVDVYKPIIQALRLKITSQDVNNLETKELLRLVMRTWLPAGDALLEMITTFLPSPVEAQRYRVSKLYTGPLDSSEADAIRNCDRAAPVSMYVSKLISAGQGRFVAFGRVFTGVLKSGDEVRIMDSNYVHGEKHGVHKKNVQRVLLMMGGTTAQLNECPAGNICGLVGIDQYLKKAGTISTSCDFHPFQTMKFSVAPVVQKSVKPKHASDLKKMVDGLKLLSQTDQIVKVTHSCGEMVVAGAGELHLEVLLNELRENLLRGDVPVIESDPIVQYAETVTTESGYDGVHPEVCVAKSANKHNRFYVRSSAIDSGLVRAVEEEEVKLGGDLKAFSKTLVEEYKWNGTEAKKVWCFGCPPDAIGNMLVDCTKGVQYLLEVRDGVKNAFTMATSEGALCGEHMRGVRMDLMDAKVHSNNQQRKAGQILGAAKKAMLGAQLAGSPRIMEPLYDIKIDVPVTYANAITGVIMGRRGRVYSRVGVNPICIQALLPVMSSFGFAKELREKTAGNAFPQMSFSHYEVVDADPFQIGSLANKIVLETRKRKGMKVELPVFADFYDKIN